MGMNATPTPAQGAAGLAYHEAGHAVIHVLLGGTLQRVSIVRDEPPGAPMERAAGPGSGEDRIAVLLAGEVAESLAGQRVVGVSEGLNQDRERARRLAADMTSEPEALLEAERQRVLELLRTPRHWQRVVAVAQALLAQQRLEGAQLRELVGAP
jgi:ATP-dependent Zn protease